MNELLKQKTNLSDTITLATPKNKIKNLGLLLGGLGLLGFLTLTETSAQVEEPLNQTKLEQLVITILMSLHLRMLEYAYIPYSVKQAFDHDTEKFSANQIIQYIIDNDDNDILTDYWRYKLTECLRESSSLASTDIELMKNPHIAKLIDAFIWAIQTYNHDDTTIEPVDIAFWRIIGTPEASDNFDVLINKFISHIEYMTKQQVDNDIFPSLEQILDLQQIARYILNKKMALQPDFLEGEVMPYLSILDDMILMSYDEEPDENEW